MLSASSISGARHSRACSGSPARLVTILPRKGILVSDLNPRNQLLLLEVRRELERLLSRAGAGRRHRSSAKMLGAHGMNQAAKTNDDISFMRRSRLNQLMVEAAHNDMPRAR
jgi:DNA-binding GntR family transcriptional regulator